MSGQIQDQKPAVLPLGATAKDSSELTSVRDLYAGRYQRADDWPGGEVLEAPILEVSIVGMPGRDNQPGRPKVVLTLDRLRRPIVCNATNARRLATVYGDNPLLWRGRWVRVETEPVSLAGRMVAGLVLRPVQSVNGPVR